MTVAIRSATPADWPAIRRLLETSDLPLAGAEVWLASFVIAERNDEIVGCATLEEHDGAFLLRSVAVSRELRGARIGEQLVAAALDAVRRRGGGPVFLLTTTAAKWFPRFGFRRIGREELPESLTASEELRGACPATAVTMALNV
ncbi:MAG: arsenic resistance N-acetyltransferase ArsN2 [Thermoanaerobaculia bacterium]